MHQERMEYEERERKLAHERFQVGQGSRGLWVVKAPGGVVTVSSAPPLRSRLQTRHLQAVRTISQPAGLAAMVCGACAPRS